MIETKEQYEELVEAVSKYPSFRLHEADWKRLIEMIEALREVARAGVDAFLNDDGLLWIGSAEDEHGYGMEFVGITLPKDRYFSFLEALAKPPDWITE